MGNRNIVEIVVDIAEIYTPLCLQALPPLPPPPNISPPLPPMHTTSPSLVSERKNKF